MSSNTPKSIEISNFDEYIKITRTWRGFSSIFSSIGAAVFVFVVFDKDMPQLLLQDVGLAPKLFSLIFIIFALVSCYYTVADWLNKTHIFVSKAAIEIRHQPLPWLGNKRVEIGELQQLVVKRKEKRRDNRTDVSYDIVGMKADSSQFILLKDLQKHDQAVYIERQVEEYLGIKDDKFFDEFA